MSLGSLLRGAQHSLRRAVAGGGTPARAAPPAVTAPPAPRVIPVTPAAADRAAALEAIVPVLRTDRCILRAPRLVDFDVLHTITGSDRAEFEGGPSTPDESWADFCGMTATWLLRGHGIWTIELAGTDDIAGFVLIGTEPGDREHELGWLLTAAHEGRGLAFEAAEAARDHAWSALRLPSLVSYIAPGNVRSERLARRLGAVPDGAMLDGQITVWRHPARPAGPVADAGPDRARTTRHEESK